MIYRCFFVSVLTLFITFFCSCSRGDKKFPNEGETQCVLCEGYGKVRAEPFGLLTKDCKACNGRGVIYLDPEVEKMVNNIMYKVKAKGRYSNSNITNGRNSTRYGNREDVNEVRSQNSQKLKSNPYKSDYYEGKVYTGEGNGGGIRSQLSIVFGNDGRCVGISDWYEAFDSPVQIVGRYKIQNARMQVVFHIDNTEDFEGGYDVDFDFEIIEEGRVLHHDQTDYSQMGSMWIDEMTVVDSTD